MRPLDPVTLFAGGAVALVGRKIYDVFEERRVTRRRDHQVLDTLVTELAVLRAAAVSNLRTLNDELDMIERTGGQHWLLTPMTPLVDRPLRPRALRPAEGLADRRDAVGASPRPGERDAQQRSSRRPPRASSRARGTTLPRTW